MDITKLSKKDLLTMCEEKGLTKLKSKNKDELIVLLQKDTTKDLSTTIDIQNINGLDYLNTITNNSVDLILTDPPYIISKNSGMNEHYNTVKFNEDNDIVEVKTQEEWEEYKKATGLEDDSKKEKYMKYGSIYGKKYCVKTDYGNWDSEFTMEMLDQFICEYYKN